MYFYVQCVPYLLLSPTQTWWYFWYTIQYVYIYWLNVFVSDHSWYYLQRCNQFNKGDSTSFRAACKYFCYGERKENLSVWLIQYIRPYFTWLTDWNRNNTAIEDQRILKYIHIKWYILWICSAQAQTLVILIIE